MYNSIGFFKHEKSVFYRDFLDHLQHCTDQFVIAPGIRGMVMSVFTLPFGLRKLFPVKESGVVKEEEDDGFVLVEAGSSRLPQLKGVRSQALQRLIHSKG